MSENGKVAPVTGGNRGVGYELVKQLALGGYKVILTSRDPEKVQAAAQKLTESSLDVSFVRMYVDDQKSIRQAAMTVNERYRRVDVLINNAGVYFDGSEGILAMDPSILEQTMATNFFGAYHVIRAFIPLMQKQGYGRIVNVSSEYGAISEMSYQGAGAYTLSKLALNGLTRLIAAEIKGDIKINAVFANGLFLTAANLGTTMGTTVCGLWISGMGIQYVVFGGFLFLIASSVSIFLRNSIYHPIK